MNILLLNNDESFIKWLDSEKVILKEVEEIGGLTTLQLTYPLTDTIRTDINDFRNGNKIFINNVPGLKNCLYIINEVVTDDLWEGNNITFTVEDVLTELNNTPLICMNDYGSTVTVNRERLVEWFGEWYNIGTVDTGLLSERISINGTLTRMGLLRQIEEETGNYFITGYENVGNVVERTLSFLRPYNIGESKGVISPGYNSSNIVYEIDESDSYRAIAPVMSWNDDQVSRSDMNALIQSFKDLEISKGDLIPMILGETIGGGVYPLTNEGQFNDDYWRRVPGDSTYNWYKGLIQYKGNFTHTTTVMNTAQKTSDCKGFMYRCNDAGTYTYWDGSAKTTTCEVGDLWVSNGVNWKIIKTTNSPNIAKYVKAEASWVAPFNKKKGEFYVSDYDNDCKTSYTTIYSRADYDTELNGEYEVTDETTETPTTGEGSPSDFNSQHTNPKIGTIENSDLNEVSIYNDCSMTLKEKRYPNINIEVDLKDNNKDNYCIYDTLQVKIPTLDHLIGAVVTKTEKNPHSPTENTITLEPQETTGKYNLITPHFVIEDLLQKENTTFNFTGYLLETRAETVDDEEVLVDYPVTDKWVSLAVKKPDTQITVYETKATQTTVKKTTYWSKYGVSPDKSKVCGIGYSSTSADTKPWGTNYKGIFKNKCPNCGRTGGLRWNRGKRAKSAARQDGEFTCTRSLGGCDSDYSIEGNEKGSTHKKLSRISLSKSNKTDSSKLLNGKLVYSNKSTKTTTSPATTKTETSPGYTELHTAQTDNTGKFSIPLKLEGLEKEDYTFKCVFGGDETYNTCSSECSVTVPSSGVYRTVYENSTSKGGAKANTTTIDRISRSSSKSQSGVVSTTVINQAKKIVGTKTGVTAAKAIANWISKNIKWENKLNFYQSPSRTLSRKKGNCCCQTDLFLQMLEAVNLINGQTGGTLTVKYVHVRKSSTSGHVYAIVGGKYVDVTLTSNPWGNYNKNYSPSSGAYKTSTYPNLPFGRSY